MRIRRIVYFPTRRLNQRYLADLIGDQAETFDPISIKAEISALDFVEAFRGNSFRVAIAAPITFAPLKPKVVCGMTIDDLLAEIKKAQNVPEFTYPIVDVSPSQEVPRGQIWFY